MTNKRFKIWTKLKCVCKIHKQFYTHAICPRIIFKSRKNKYKHLNYYFTDGYRFINKSHYDFRC